ncbi:MAG: hypothetical protein ACK5M7_18605, partial [Draconibacterium sp.]
MKTLNWVDAVSGVMLRIWGLLPNKKNKEAVQKVKLDSLCFCYPFKNCILKAAMTTKPNVRFKAVT